MNIIVSVTVPIGEFCTGCRFLYRSGRSEDQRDCYLLNQAVYVAYGPREFYKCQECREAPQEGERPKEETP